MIKTQRRKSETARTALDKNPKLTTLILFKNELSGSIPTSNRKPSCFLTTLNLFMNELSGSILASIGNLAALSELQLNENKLYGSISTTYQSHQIEFNDE
ncbi:hypothetical protein CMV_018960 [Castanea mollissima]|uniref:Uncharacterized protein n=1 Tax=Castanea mollissima TaxID=60419 RepID=A0A8J4VC24_9ROSI|nr:hypothetical protein CMV_018960 [Castanea mollissima]